MFAKGSEFFRDLRGTRVDQRMLQKHVADQGCGVFGVPTGERSTVHLPSRSTSTRSNANSSRSWSWPGNAWITTSPASRNAATAARNGVVVLPRRENRAAACFDRRDARHFAQVERKARRRRAHGHRPGRHRRNGRRARPRSARHRHRPRTSRRCDTHSRAGRRDRSSLRRHSPDARGTRGRRARAR